LCCPNQTCFSSLESKLQGAFVDQISSLAFKLVGSCATKPERGFKVL
jgi:hypothetical protein